MKSKKLPVKNLPDNLLHLSKGLSNEGLSIILENREKALEYARKGIAQKEPEKLNNEYIELVADSMQVFARMLLEERGILGKS